MAKTVKTVSNSQLTPGKFVYVKGKVGFSRIGRQTNEAELAKYNQGRKFEQNTPITQLTIYDAEVLYTDANAPTIEETYVSESMYASSKKEYTGKCYNPVNKTRNLPAVKVQNASDPKKYDDYDLRGRELARGTEVVVGMRTFKGNGNNGISLDHVIVMGELKLLSVGDNGAAKSALARFGITFTNEPSPLSDGDVAEVPDTVEDDGDDSGEPAETETPFANNTAAQQEPPQEASAPSTGASSNPFNQPAASSNPFNVGAGAKRQY